jgi:hypothetical protein
MVSIIPPKPRETAKLSYYTKGESEKSIKPSFFKTHAAEPGHAATILQRNPVTPEEFPVKPLTSKVRTSGYTPGLYAGRSDKVEHNWKGPSSLSEAKLIKQKEYAL